MNDVAVVALALVDAVFYASVNAPSYPIVHVVVVVDVDVVVASHDHTPKPHAKRNNARSPFRFCRSNSFFPQNIVAI